MKFKLFYTFFIIFLISILEIFSRVIDNKEIYTLKNWVTIQLEQNTENQTFSFHPNIGWVGKKNVNINGDLKISNTTIPNIDQLIITHNEYGFRKTGVLDQSKKNILTVGDSFTWGSEVNDSDSYPFQLNNMVDFNVINVANGGYGTDLMWLQLQDKIKQIDPEVVIKSPNTNALLINAYRRWGRAFKPYYEVKENKKLILKNTPVPRNSDAVRDIGIFQSVFGRFYLFTFIFNRIGLSEVWINKNKLVDKVMTNEEAVEVGCLILQEMNESYLLNNRKFLLVLLYGNQEILNKERFWYTKIYLECAQKTNIQVLDTYEEFVKISKHKSFPGSHYNKHNNGLYGHMTPEGNRLVAQLIADYLKINDW